MAATPEVDSVWIGFMDIVPVIGTVKEAVELVLALYEGDDRVIREKAKAVENFVKESLKKPVKKSVSGKPAAAAAASSDFSGLRNVREVKKEMIIEYMAKGSKRGTKPAPARQEQRKTSVDIEAIKREILRKIHIIDQNFNQELQIELVTHGRGEHVFNNSILKFHYSVLDAFVKDKNIDKLQGYNKPTIDKLGEHTLPQDTANDIQNRMVAHFDANEPYFNLNAVVYGVYKRHLLDALLAVLKGINAGEETPEERRRINHIIVNMNNLEIYVDELARVKWIGNGRDKPDKQAQVEAVRGEVVTMFNTDRVLEWCNRVLKETAPWFGNPQ